MNKHPDQDRIRKLLKAHKKDGSSDFIKILTLRTVKHPLSEGKPNKEAIKQEVDKLCRIHRINKTRDADVYQQIRFAVFEVYNLSP